MELSQRRSNLSTKRPNDHREPYQRDKARILHSAAFRRLQAKTQILGVGQDDFYRTRLTHSLEVAQIGTGLLAQLRQSHQVTNNPIFQKLLPPDSLIESLCLAHDIGHPPFGHGGEVALNYMMHNFGGFEANGQTLRIVSKLEPYTESHGMDLTRRTFLGLIKYPQFIEENPNYIASETNHEFINAKQWKPTKGLFEVDKDVYSWVMETTTTNDAELFTSAVSEDHQSNTPYIKSKTHYKSFDASLMELADDIAYAVHDLEDAIVLNNVTESVWRSQVLASLKALDNKWAKTHSEQLTVMLFSSKHFERKNAIGALVNHLITNIGITEQHSGFDHPILRYNVKLESSAESVLNLLKDFVYQNVILSAPLQQAEFRGQQMLVSLFKAIQSDPFRLLPTDLSLVYQSAGSLDLQNRLTCDFLANMSDVQATRLYNTMFVG